MQSGGGRYDVETGRRDGLESASIVDLPSPRFSVNQSLEAFEKKGLNLTDMVLLLGMFFLLLEQYLNLKS